MNHRTCNVCSLAVGGIEGRRLMRHLLWTSLVGAAMLTASACPAHAQTIKSETGPATAQVTGAGAAVEYVAPGSFATSWGVPSYGWPRTYTAFSSPYGQAYGYGYTPYVYWPGYTGAQVWRPAATLPDTYRAGNWYRNLASPHSSFTGGFFSPFGYYPPGVGPSAWYAY
jgi:hypothetical protein